VFYFGIDALFTASKACLRAQRGCGLRANTSLEQFNFEKLNCSNLEDHPKTIHLKIAERYFEMKLS
jgi:hypothetical protein